jgi:hypothetical protein
MIQKSYVEANGKTFARVTFTLPRSTRSEVISLVGDFNDWDPTSHPFRRDHVGKWTLTLDLELRRAYQFRYLLDDGEWMHSYSILRGVITSSLSPIQALSAMTSSCRVPEAIIEKGLVW